MLTNIADFHACHAAHQHLLADWQRCVRLPPALGPDWYYGAPLAYYHYFAARGIAPELVWEAQARPLTVNPSTEEQAAYRHCLKQHRLNEKSGAPDPLVEGILFPYFIDEAEFGAFGVARGFTWQESFGRYFEERGDRAPKCLSPKAHLVKATSHLYILPSQAPLINKQSVAIHLIEGQAKALKLVQDFRSAGLADDNAVIGLTGVEQFLPAPETHQIQWRNRLVYIWFDADRLRKPSVAQAELKAAAYVLTRGAKAVLAPHWSEERGNGYDDHSVFMALRNIPPAANLKKLISKAKDPFRHYAPDDDTPGLPLESVCECIAKVPNAGAHKSIFLGKLKPLYKSLGLKEKDIKATLEEALNRAEEDRQHEQIQLYADQLKQVFGIHYAPQLPDDFRLRDGHLCFFDSPLCRVFVVKKYIASEHQDDQDQYLIRFANKELLIPSDVFTNYRSIAQMFNRNQEILCDSTAKLIQKYISLYWLNNKQHIPIVPLFRNTGWDSAGNFRLPTLDEESEYDPHIKQAFQVHGEADKQLEFVRNTLTQHPAAVVLLLGFATPLIGLLNLKPMICMIFGGAGDGKSTAAFAALSLYGKYQELYQSMNATKVGKEITFALSKDLPVVLDELNTAGNGDGVQLAKSLIETIYGFYSGKGRTRGTINVTLAKQHEYQGLLMLTSERSLETIFSVIPDMTIAGAYRRTLEIPCLTRQALWHVPDSANTTFFKDTYESISTHYGHVGKLWLEYLSDTQTQKQIKADYARILELNSAEGLDLKGTETLLALIEAIAPHVAQVVGLPASDCYENITPLLTEIKEHQQRQITYQMQSGVEKFIEAINSFITLHPTCFDGICPPELAMSKIFGEVGDEGPWRHVYLRPVGLQTFCNDFGFDRNGLLHHLKEHDILQLWEIPKFDADKRPVLQDGAAVIDRVEYKSLKIRGTGGNAYHLRIPAPGF